MLRDVSVREVMNGDYVGVSESDDLVESVKLLLTEGADVGVVLRGDEAVGTISETGALATFVERDDVAGADVGTAMTSDVPTIRPDRGLHEARDRMTTMGMPWLVVTEGERPLGVITEHDLLAGSTMVSEPGPADDRENDSGVVAPSATAAEAEPESATEGAFEDQGICEICGSLSADLTSLNGQLRCPDCREV